MSRVAEITVPPERSASLLARIKTLPEVISVRLESGISVKPPGDVISVVITDHALAQLFGLLDELGIMQDQACAVSTNSLMGLIHSPASSLIRDDSSHFTSEEMDQEINKESRMSSSSLFGMAIAGAVAVAGIETGALHLVIGAMVIAPGFEPISRIALGVVHRSPSWRRGTVDFFKGYLSLIAGAIAATWILQIWGIGPSHPQANYLASHALLGYWSTFSAVSLLVSVLAATAGALLIIGQRSVLTAGVMIALALIPAAALTGMGIASANPGLLATGLARLSIEVLIVALMSALVFWGNRHWTERRTMAS